MRITEKCGCGASIEVAYATADQYPRGEAEQTQAADAMNTWRELHKACVPKPAFDEDRDA